MSVLWNHIILKDVIYSWFLASKTLGFIILKSYTQENTLDYLRVEYKMA